MNKTSTLLLSLLFSFGLFADTLTVKQDGAGDYTIIQEAIEASVDGDTILVFPGTYYENLQVYGKKLTIGSLTLTTGNMAYINQTIINGNQTGGCFDIRDYADITINGFTLTGGIGTLWGNRESGGGLLIYYSDVYIFNSIIKDNSCTGAGGGFYTLYSYLYLSNTTIKNNSCYKDGGGILGGVTYLVFDTVNLCNIYGNTAARGTDIYYSNGMPPYIYNHIIVDTCTVIEPDYYYLYSTKYDTNLPGNTLSWEVKNGKYEQTTQNIYVSNSGDNNNSGLTPGDPLKNIWSAFLRMKSDSISPDTIILENGVYSPSNGEKYPLSAKRDVSIRGESREETILDAEDEIYHIRGIYFANNYNISNLTFTNGNGYKNSPYGRSGINLEKNINASITNVLFTKNKSLQTFNNYIGASNNFKIENTNFIDNMGGAVSFAHGDLYIEIWDTVYVNNCIFSQNNSDTGEVATAGGLGFTGSVVRPNTHECVVTNCIFVDSYLKDNNNGAGPLGVASQDGANTYIINCTFAKNTSDNNKAGAISTTYGSDTEVYNSIFYDNQYYSAYLSTSSYFGQCNLSIYHSLVDGGESSINQITSLTNYYYDNSNIDTDPLFYGGSEFPYNLSDNSPCIDAGTLDIPDWIELPEYDLAGNPRIYGETIDMGAYEWNPSVGIVEQQMSNLDEKLLSIAPNPVVTSTVVSVIIKKSTNLKIEVFNNNGQRVDVIFDSYVQPGAIQTTWNCATNGNRLTSGIYHVVLSEDGVEKDVVKMVVR